MFEEYVVKDGDNLVSIAKQFGVPIYQLIVTNNLQDVISLTPGMVLQIPLNPRNAFRFYTIKPGDTLTSIAEMFNISVHDLESLNGLDPNQYLYPGEKILVPREGVYVYITKPGDSLQTVANENSIRPEEILIYNDQLYLLPDQIIAFKIKNLEEL